jgi:hypothetical protein
LLHNVIVRRGLLSAVFLLGLSETMVFADATSLDLSVPGLAALYARYRCPIEDKLRRIYDSGDPAVERDRFLIIEVDIKKQAYVQCVFHDHELKILCEVASGFYFDDPRTFYLPPDNIAALGRLGFSTDDSKGNFVLDADVGRKPDFGAIAEGMLNALFYGFDADAATDLNFIAPYAPGVTSACKSLS